MEKLSWRVEAGPLGESGPHGIQYQVWKVFPNVMAFGSHNCFVFTKSYLNKDKPAIRRNEDLMQDGELITRSFYEYFGMESKDCPPFLMAGDCNTNNGKKGDSITFSVYYYDINKLPPKNVTLVINGKNYEMQTAGKADYKKPVLYQCNFVLNEQTNDYYFTASNGKKERRIPENYSLPGPFIIK